MTNREGWSFLFHNMIIGSNEPSVTSWLGARGTETATVHKLLKIYLTQKLTNFDLAMGSTKRFFLTGRIKANCFFFCLLPSHVWYQNVNSWWSSLDNYLFRGAVTVNQILSTIKEKGVQVKGRGWKSSLIEVTRHSECQATCSYGTH